MSRSHFIPTLAVAAVLAIPASPALAQEGAAHEAAHHAEGMVDVRGSTLEWAPIEVPGFDSGLQIAVLHGDPSADGPYTLRLAFPDGYTFPPHWHPMAENLTVVSGTFLLGMGGEADAEALETYEPGDYLMIPAEMAHFGQVEGETVVQLHGLGPFEIYLVDEAAADAGDR